MPTRIFVSYRHSSSSAFAGRLFDRLSHRFGRDSIFYDIASMSYSTDFRDRVKQCLEVSDVVLVVIGPDWTGASDAGRRIDDPNDPVRVECEAALNLKKAILPVYHETNQLSEDHALPPPLSQLLYLHSLHMSVGCDFDAHMRRLCDELIEIISPGHLGKISFESQRAMRRHSWTLGAISTCVILVVIFGDWLGRGLVTVEGLPRLLARLDPAVFAARAVDRTEVARAIPGRPSLFTGTDLDRSLAETAVTFDAQVQGGGALTDRVELLQQLLDRDVRIRILLWDPSVANRANIQSYVEATASPGVSVGNMLERIRISAEQLSGLTGTGPKQRVAQIRYWRGPLVNTLWIRDGRDESNALLHLEVILHHGDASMTPMMRFGRLSPGMIKLLQSHFDSMWEQSIEHHDLVTSTNEP